MIVISVENDKHCIKVRYRWHPRFTFTRGRAVPDILTCAGNWHHHSKSYNIKVEKCLTTNS
jgi:hypothetical protein